MRLREARQSAPVGGLAWNIDRIEDGGVGRALLLVAQDVRDVGAKPERSEVCRDRLHERDVEAGPSSTC